MKKTFYVKICFDIQELLCQIDEEETTKKNHTKTKEKTSYFTIETNYLSAQFLKTIFGFGSLLLFFIIIYALPKYGYSLL